LVFRFWPLSRGRDSSIYNTAGRADRPAIARALRWTTARLHGLTAKIHFAKCGAKWHESNLAAGWRNSQRNGTFRNEMAKIYGGKENTTSPMDEGKRKKEKRIKHRDRDRNRHMPDKRKPPKKENVLLRSHANSRRCHFIPSYPRWLNTRNRPEPSRYYGLGGFSWHPCRRS